MHDEKVRMEKPLDHHQHKALKHQSSMIHSATWLPSLLPQLPSKMHDRRSLARLQRRTCWFSGISEKYLAWILLTKKLLNWRARPWFIRTQIVSNKAQSNSEQKNTVAMYSNCRPTAYNDTIAGSRTPTTYRRVDCQRAFSISLTREFFVPSTRESDQ